MMVVHHIDVENYLASCISRRYRAEMFDGLARDVRYAFRSLLSRPTYALVAIATLALVIGAASAVIAVVNATMIRPLRFPAGDRLAQIFTMPPGTTGVGQRNPLHPRTFYRFRTAGLQTVEAVEGVWARERALGGDAEPETASAGSVSPGVFMLFGRGPLLGRTWTEAEDRDNARVVVLSHGTWQRRFAADPSVIGRTVLIDRVPHQVIGVMPRGFRLAFVDTELWTPLNIHAGTLDANASFVQTFARLRPRATVAQMLAELQPVMQGVVAESPKMLGGWTPEAATLRDAQFGTQRSNLLTLLAGVLALVLIASANLANLTLAHVASRRSEFALRAALGGGRTAIVRLQVIETLLLVVAGTAAGILLGAWTLPLLLRLDPTTSRVLSDVTIDWRVQGLTAALAAAVAVLAGVLPVVRGIRGDVAQEISESTLRTAGSRRHGRVRSVLIGAEAAMAVVLLVCGALLLSAFDRTARQHPGFEPEGVLGAQLRIPESAYPTEAARTAFITQVLERIRAIPGVIAAGTTLNIFQPGFAFVTLVRIEGRPTPDGQAHTVQFRRISPDYFKTMGIRLLSGRDFGAQDIASSLPVVIVSQTFAERFWPGEDPMGRRVERGANARMHSVIGVVDDLSDVGFGQAAAATIYVTYPQNNVALTPTSLVVRTAGDPLALTGAIRGAILSVDPAQPIDHVTTLDRFLSDSLGPQRFRTTLLLILGALGLAIAAVGIYGVTARAVGERTRELGVRLALGATPSGLLSLVMRQALTAIGTGLAAGAALAAMAAATMRQTLANLDHADPWSAVIAIVVLAAIAALAAIIPARRAVAMDPTTALRTP
jgi:putative ABC transport system permease protein